MPRERKHSRPSLRFPSDAGTEEPCGDSTATAESWRSLSLPGHPVVGPIEVLVVIHSSHRNTRRLRSIQVVCTIKPRHYIFTFDYIITFTFEQRQQRPYLLFLDNAVSPFICVTNS